MGQRPRPSAVGNQIAGKTDFEQLIEANRRYLDPDSRSGLTARPPVQPPPLEEIAGGGEVSRLVGLMNGRTNELHETVRVMSQRLSGVISTHPTGTSTAEQPPMASPLGCALCRIDVHLQEIMAELIALHAAIVL